MATQNSTVKAERMIHLLASEEVQDENEEFMASKPFKIGGTNNSTYQPSAIYHVKAGGVNGNSSKQQEQQ